MAKQSLETTGIRSSNPTFVQAQTVPTPAGNASLKVVVGYIRKIKVRVTGSGIRNG